jgi:SagB-type dehydrogenase family enzyme
VTQRADIVRAYHQRTKHRIDCYAPGPETLDWDAQPNPFRYFEGCQRIPLTLGAEQLETPFGALYEKGGVAPQALSQTSIGTLLQLSLGLSAWKEYGPDRWAVRCNPSSGNLHPTEAYLISSGIPGLDGGLYHYLSREHALEQRARFSRGGNDEAQPGLWIGLSSIHWREAWKYGERAFRYCQLDIGHALGALRYAVGALGWTATIVPGLSGSKLAAILGLDRAGDFAGVEREDADVLIAIGPGQGPPFRNETETEALEALAAGALEWAGHANRLDPHPLYRWPIIDSVSAATSERAKPPEPLEMPPQPVETSLYPRFVQPSLEPVASLILNRRSAQRFDSKFSMDAGSFFRLLDALLVRDMPPWDIWREAPRIHPVFFVHRVEGLDPGLYILPRHQNGEAALRQSLSPEFSWQKPEAAPDHLPFFKLTGADCKRIARTTSCHQAIAGDGCFSLGMLAEFDPVISGDPWCYRRLHWEAGLLGHVLYLEAEAAGLRGTGIGCYFDDAFHDLLGLTGAVFQSLYHFTVGRPLVDERISTSPPYPGRGEVDSMEHMS